MDLRSICITNGTGAFILLMLIYVSQTKVQRRWAEDKVYLTMVAGVLFACIAEMFSYSIDGIVFPGARALNIAANTYLYIVNALLSFCILVYFDVALYDDLSRIPRLYKPQIAVAAVMLAANVVNLFVPITYYISPENVYERRPFSYCYLIAMLYFSFSALMTTRRYEKESKMHAFLDVRMFLIPVVIGACLQFTFYGLSLGWLASSVGLACLYMMQQNEMAYIDPTTDIYNRQYMNHIISSWAAGNSRFAGIMLDIDRFKAINDGFGHAEGDEAIRVLAQILMKARCSGEQVFRFAGDEFFILKKTDSIDGLDQYIERMLSGIDEYNRTSGKGYEIAISYGTGFYDQQSKGLDGFMKQLDDRMYEMKAIHHGEACKV